VIDKVTSLSAIPPLSLFSTCIENLTVELSLALTITLFEVSFKSNTLILSATFELSVEELFPESEPLPLVLLELLFP
jgi:hypothetical protein